ncbi:MAG: DUF3429 domain-containing protein [Parvularculaceae bacterium]
MSDRQSELTFLGYAGLLPFAAGAVGAWVLPAPHAAEAAGVGVAYGGIIAAYMAGVGAGELLVGVRAEGPREPLLAGMVAALVAWLAAAPAIFGVDPSLAARAGALAIVFAWLLLRDLRAVRRGGLPAWYGPLRIRLTLGACAALGAIAIRGA